MRGRPREGQPRVRSRSRSRLLLASPASCSSQRAAGGYCNLADLGRDGQLGAALASLSALAVASGWLPRRSICDAAPIFPAIRRASGMSPPARSTSPRSLSARPSARPRHVVTSKDGAPSPPRGPGGGAGLGRPGGPPGGGPDQQLALAHASHVSRYHT